MVSVVFVSIPYERESTSERATAQGPTPATGLSFNSLRTGKYIWTKLLKPEKGKEEKSFNSLRTGKYIWTNYGTSGRAHSYYYVSIPYERESTSEPFCLVLLFIPLFRFVSIPYERESTSEQADRKRCPPKPHFVSIPYERESTSELKIQTAIENDESDEFQFPTNGKVHLNLQYRNYLCR